jgi:LysR family transcriptional regulator for bpeEF and oprC
MSRMSTGGRLDNLHGILVFLRVVDAGSLSAAARSLGVSTSAVSAALARLEKRLSTRLVNRTTRRLNVTEEGEEFYQRCKKIVADLEAAEHTVGRAGLVPSGTLRVGVPSTLGTKWIVPQLGRFVAEYPAVTVEVVCTDFVPATIGEGLDISVRIGEQQDSSLAVRRLAVSEYVTCASPEYLKAHGTPKHPSELNDHRCLTYRRPRTGRIWEWRFQVDGVVRMMEMQGLVTINSHEATVSAAAAGMGIVQAADYYAHPYILRGDLVEILQEFKTDGYLISAVFPKERPFSPKIRAFVDFLARQFDRPPWSARAVNSGAKEAAKDEHAAPRLKVRREIRRVRYQPASNRARSDRARTPSTRA